MFITGVVGPSQANVTATMMLFDVVKALTVGQDGFPVYKENYDGLYTTTYTHKPNIFIRIIHTV